MENYSKRWAGVSGWRCNQEKQNYSSGCKTRNYNYFENGGGLGGSSPTNMALGKMTYDEAQKGGGGGSGSNPSGCGCLSMLLIALCIIVYMVGNIS